MKLTKSQLKEMIREELKLTEKISSSILMKAKKKSSDTYERTVYAANGNQFSFYSPYAITLILILLIHLIIHS